MTKYFLSMALRGVEIAGKDGTIHKGFFGCIATASDSALVVRGTAAAGSRMSAASKGAGLPAPAGEATSRRLK